MRSHRSTGVKPREHFRAPLYTQPMSLKCNLSLESLQLEALFIAATPDVFTSKKYINVVIILTIPVFLYHNKHTTPETFLTQQGQHYIFTIFPKVSTNSVPWFSPWGLYLIILHNYMLVYFTLMELGEHK